MSPAPALSATDSANSTPAGPSLDPSAVACTHSIGGASPDPDGDGYRLVLGAVVLPSRVLEVHDAGEPGWHFAKHGLVLRAGTAVELVVAPEAADDARIGWGSPGPEGTTIRVPACPQAAGWLAFAGGYTVRTPMCVPLLVRANGREERATVSVGKPCPADRH
ncbi:hypothetical protein OHA21_08785 [Actinoplanes sp. NBC_00393]|uniref:hypothetical protein n=1 Tax=Actinoplanes sp. NBC_00393 TaxID=2975953 RepID=UPI002E1E5D32